MTFVNNIDLDLFLRNLDRLPCKCNNSPFADRHHKHIVTGDLRIIRNNVLRRLCIKGPKYRAVRPINLDIPINNISIDNIPLKNHRLPNMYWMPKMHKSPIKAIFIIASPKSSIKPLASTITSIFCLFFRQIQIYNDKCRFFTGVNTFWVVQNNKPVTDAMNGLNNQRKATSVSTIDFSTFHTKLPHNKLLMVLNSLIDFCFDGGENKYSTVSNCGARWVKNIKDNVIYLYKQEIKDAVEYCYFTVVLKSSVRLLVFLWSLIQLPFLPTYSYIFLKVSG